MENQSILAIVGMPGSGKSVVCEYLAQKGYHVIYFGGIVLKETLHRGYPQEPAYEKIVREDLRIQYGMGGIAILALPQIEMALREGKKVLIDGLYSLAELKNLKSTFGDALIVIAVFANKPLRYQRLAQRTVRPLTKEQAEQRDWDEIETIEKGGPIALANYTILNNGNQENLIAQTNLIMSFIENNPWGCS